jgi:hypothetical protein
VAGHRGMAIAGGLHRVARQGRQPARNRGVLRRDQRGRLLGGGHGPRPPEMRCRAPRSLPPLAPHARVVAGLAGAVAAGRRAHQRRRGWSLANISTQAGARHSRSASRPVVSHGRLPPVRDGPRRRRGGARARAARGSCRRQRAHLLGATAHGRQARSLRASNVMTPVARRAMDAMRQGSREPQYSTYRGD